MVLVSNSLQNNKYLQKIHMQITSFLKVSLICHKFVFQVKAPWLKHFVYTGDDYTCYIIPGLVDIVDGQLGIKLVIIMIMTSRIVIVSF